jgi:hypothetical protein
VIWLNADTRNDAVVKIIMITAHTQEVLIVYEIQECKTGWTIIKNDITPEIAASCDRGYTRIFIPRVPL